MEKVQIKAGAGSAVIAFPKEMFPADDLYGVHENPYARVLVIEAGKKAAIASIELVNIFEDHMEEVKKIIAKETQTDIENVWVHVTHAITTPHIPGGPFFGKKRPEGMPGPKEEPDTPAKNAAFKKTVNGAIEKAARKAAVLSQAKYGAVIGTTNVNINRDFESPFGWWVGQNPLEPSNKEMPVLKIETLEGKMIALLVWADLKPCCIDQSGRKDGSALVDPDVPGYACRKLEEKLQAPVMFFMSAAGDQVTRMQSYTEYIDDKGAVYAVDDGAEKGFELVELLGEEMLSDIERAADKIRCETRESFVNIGASKIPFTRRVNERRQSAPVRKINFVPDKEDFIDAGAIVLGDDFAFVAAKPEVNTVTGQQLKARSPYKVTTFAAMVNGGMKYMPDIRSCERCTWEAGSTMMMPGTAEKWVDGAVSLLESMRGK